MALLILGSIILAAQWIGDHPLPAVLIIGGLVAAVVAGIAYRSQAVPTAPPPPRLQAGYCPSCGAPRTVGQAFCSRCGEELLRDGVTT